MKFRHSSRRRVNCVRYPTQIKKKPVKQISEPSRDGKTSESTDRKRAQGCAGATPPYILGRLTRSESKQKPTTSPAGHTARSFPLREVFHPCSSIRSCRKPAKDISKKPFHPYSSKSPFLSGNLNMRQSHSTGIRPFPDSRFLDSAPRTGRLLPRGTISTDQWISSGAIFELA